MKIRLPTGICPEQPARCPLSRTRRHPLRLTFHISRGSRAFTLVEILVAMGILSLVLAAIYSSWTAILRASKVGTDAAAAVQRARMTGRIIEEALSSAQYVEPQSPAQRDEPFYDFIAQNGDEATLSFVSQLSSKYFPRSVKFGPWTVRRVTFMLRSGPEGGRELVLSQQPIMWEQPDEDEQNYPLVLAKNVREFKTEFWDAKLQDWTDEWKATNSLPPLVKVTLKMSDNPNSTMVREEVCRIVSLPAQGVTRQWQPWTGGQGRPGGPLAPGAPGGLPNPAAPGNQNQNPGFLNPQNAYGNPGYGNPGYGNPGYGNPGYGRPGSTFPR